MNYQEWKEEFENELKDIFEEKGMDVTIREEAYDIVNRHVDGTCLQLNGAEIVPTLHTNTIYERWMESDYTIRDVAESVADSLEAEYDKISELGFQASDFTEEYVRENAYVSVINTEMNQDMLQRIPHEEISGTDLTGIVKVPVGESATITITNEHIASFGMSQNEIMDVARENTLQQEFSVQSLEDVVKSYLPEELANEMSLFPEREMPNVVFVSNETGFDGANAILSKETLDEVCQKLETNDITIIPSSRHELLAVNPEQLGIESTAEIKGMVEQINHAVVPLEDQISNNIYHYDGMTHELEMCDERGIFREVDSEEYDREFEEEMRRGR